MMEANESWLIGKLNVGYRVVDLGVDTARSSRGVFYSMEKETIMEWGSTTGKKILYTTK